MSRSNYDKPFYVDVGTSIIAVRCASNHDVILEFNHCGSWKQPQFLIGMANSICDRMNKEVEIHKPLRNCDVGTEKYDCRLAWAHMPYDNEVWK